MIKLIHTGDFHIGVPTLGMRGRDVKNLRRNDIFNAIKDVFRYAKKEKVDIIIISGDIFHSPNPSPHEFLMLDEIFKIAEHDGIHIVIIAGNHDKKKIRGEKGYLSIYKSRGGEFIHYEDTIVDDPLILKINGEKIGFVLIPYISGKFVRARTWEQYKIRYNEVVSEVIRKQLGKLTDVDYRILVGHLTVSGTKIGPNISYVAYDDPPVSINSIFPEKFNYIALGHIHLPQKIGDNIYYCGSIERIDFSEEKYDKSFLHINLNGKAYVKRVLLDPRNMITINIHLSPLSNPISQIINSLSNYNITNALVRFRVTGEAEVINKLYLETHKLDNILIDKYKVAAYKIETQYISKQIFHNKLNYEEIDFAKVFVDYIKNRFRNKRKEVIDEAVEIGRGLLGI